MKQTLDLQDIPRFLACPGSFLLSQKAELLFGPEEISQPTGEDVKAVSLFPALPIDGVIDQLSVAPGQMHIAMPGDEDILTAAMVAATHEYDFAYEFEVYNITYLEHDGKGRNESVHRNDVLQRAKDFQARFKAALSSVERGPNEYCDTCPARAICPEYRGEVLDSRLAKTEITTAEELSAILPHLQALTEKAEQSVRKMLVKGTKVPGYRLGDGKRVWKDEEKTTAYLKRNVKKFKTVLIDEKLKSVDEAEKVLENAEFNRPVNLDTHIVTLPGDIERES